MKKYIEPSIKVRMIEAETILTSSNPNALVTPIDNDHPASGPACGKEAVLPKDGASDAGSQTVWDD